MNKFLCKLGILAALALACGGCADLLQQEPEQKGLLEFPEGYNFPLALPIWVVEDDPNMTIYDRKDLDRDRQVGKIMVIPLYMNYRNDDGTVDRLAIAHPFSCRPGEDFEVTLASFGQREMLRRLIVWVPGYFTGSIPRIFRWVPVINGKKMVVLELQPCLGKEASQINATMAEMLQSDIIIGDRVFLRRPAHSQKFEARMSDEPYDSARVVRSNEYEGRYFNNGYAENNHVLWGFEAGARVKNRLTPEEKKMVAGFAAAAMQDRPTSSTARK